MARLKAALLREYEDNQVGLQICVYSIFSASLYKSFNERSRFLLICDNISQLTASQEHSCVSIYIL